MAKCPVKRVLISVYDKTDIVEFARALVDGCGAEIISTGGTAALLAKSGIAVTPVEEVTGFGEMMDGRVKTLHPRIHAAILADRDNQDHLQQLQAQDIEPIDMVVVNLYPFGETVAQPDCTFAQAIEMIDIGGPCLLRAAAKNHKHVLPVCHPDLYEECFAFIQGKGNADPASFRSLLASFAFDMTSDYDLEIQCYLEEKIERESPGEAVDPTRAFLEEDGAGLIQVWGGSQKTRYGENPHQKGAYLHGDGEADIGVSPTKVISGEQVSFNNYADADAALRLCTDLTSELKAARAACVFAKHTNACGVGVADDPIEAYTRAYLGDPNAAMGGVLACNFEVNAEVAQAVMETYDRWGKQAGAGGFFVEVWVAPAFEPAAVEAITSMKKWGKRVRLMALGDAGATGPDDELDSRSILGGVLVQTRDQVGLNEDQWKVVTERSPTDAELANLRLAWLTCKHTKSNAITICNDRMLLGNGAGQMSRVMSCRIATWLAKENGHGERLTGAAAASDAFFPFHDGPDILMDAGVSAIIQPGGSKRDADTVAACNERGVAMIHTGTRHFRH